MARKYEMSWEGRPNYRWVKMHKGVRYRVTCEQLRAKVWAEEATYKLANEWWKAKLAELEGPTPRQAAIAEIDSLQAEIEAAKRKAAAAEELLRLKTAAKTEEAIATGEMSLAEFLGADPKALDNKPEALAKLAEIFNRTVNAEALVNKVEQAKNDLGTSSVPAERRVDRAGAEFLALIRVNQKPKTYQECRELVAMVSDWYGRRDVKSVDEQFVGDAFKRFAEQTVSPNSKKKRWNIFKRFIAWCGETGYLDSPRNLNSKLFRFRVPHRSVESWSVPVVRSALAGLPERFRLWALLGLNCGMTNADIAELQKSQVVDGRLTRRRVKTGELGSVPTVCYPLWTETLELMTKFKSKHTTLWFASRAGTKLLTNSITSDGSVKTKDLIILAWRRAGLHTTCPIPLFKFRSVSATALDAHESYGRYSPYFLAHSPGSVSARHYVVPSQDQFDLALAWLREYLLGVTKLQGNSSCRSN